MQPRSHTPFGFELGILVCVILRILERDMNNTVHLLLGETGAEHHFPNQQTAEVAARIATLCRRLAEQIRHYQSMLWTEDEQEHPDDDIPF